MYGGPGDRVSLLVNMTEGALQMKTFAEPCEPIQINVRLFSE